MKPPCRHPAPVPSGCRWCALAQNLDTRYLSKWWPEAPHVGDGPCIHRGEPTGERRRCGDCRKGEDEIKLMPCALHGACTLARKVDGAKVCRTCTDREPYRYFDRVVLVNLKSRPDRLANFRRQQAENGWPLAEPAVFEAIHGATVGVPAGYTAGAGAYGCARSHTSILERALMDGVQSLLVLEDDACWLPTMPDALATFMAVVPPDWEQLMLGGEHRAPPAPVAPGVLQCRNCQRTHAYAVRGGAMKDLLRLWHGARGHIDHAMGPWQVGRRVYAPEPFLFGQEAGRSDITGRETPRRFWGGATEVAQA